MIGPVYLWLVLCLNSECTYSQVWQYKTYPGVKKLARKQCENDKREGKREFDLKYKGTYFLECKTEKQVDQNGFDYVRKIENQKRKKHRDVQLTKDRNDF